MFSLFRRSIRQMSDAVATATASTPATTTTVFVRNLSFEAPVKSVVEALAANGLTPVSVRFPSHQDSADRHRGFGWVQFADQSQAEQAVEAVNGLQIEGRALMAKFHDPESKPEQPKSEASRTLFVGNIPHNATEADLTDIFAPYADSIVAVRMAKNHDTGSLKGFAHVQFKDNVVAQKAMEEQNGAVMQGRPLRLDFAQQKRDR